MIEANTSCELTVGDETLRVLRYRTDCATSGVDSVECVLDTSLEEELKGDTEYLGRAAQLLLEDDARATNYRFEGEVTRAARITDADGVKRLTLILSSPLFRLALRKDSRIFQDKSIQEIVDDVFSAAGILTRKRWASQAHEQPRPYCVQYEETDLEFVHRLLGEAGISWLYRREDDAPVIVFTDRLLNLDEEDPLEFSFSPNAGTVTASLTIQHVEDTHQVRPDSARINGYDPQRPSLRIEASEQEAEGTNEIYAPLMRDADPDRAEQLALRLLQGHQGVKRVIRGESGTLQLQIGTRFSLVDHPYDPLNGEYVVFALGIFGERTREFALESGAAAARRGTEFWAIPVEGPWAPEPVQPARIVPGLQTAITTGPAGEEINTNEHGEVTVHFHWDRSGPQDDGSSRYMRTSQLPTGGSMLLPRVGWEVAVAFHEGDVDQPMVMSRLYNGQTMPPYSLPGEAVTSSIQTSTSPADGTSNEVRMSDTKGNEHMMFNASYDMSVQIGNNTTESIGHDHSTTIGANQSTTIVDSFRSTVGANQSHQVSGNQKQSIATLGVEDVAADHSASVGGNRTQMIGGDHRRTVEGSSEVNVGGMALTAAIGTVDLDAGGGFEHKVGAALIEIVGGSRSVMTAATRSETTGGAKVIVSKGARAVEAGTQTTQIGGAMLVKAKGNRSDSAGMTWTETAGGAQKIEANNVTIEGQLSVTLTMGAASIVLSPASVTISGADVKLEGTLVQTSPMNLNN